MTGVCGGANAIQSINANGGVTCVSVAGGTGDITGVYPGNGLTGGGASGEVTLTVAFGGSESVIATEATPGMPRRAATTRRKKSIRFSVVL